MLKDVFLCSHKTSNRKLQLGFVDQDVVIYKDELDISCLYNDNSFFIHRNNHNSKSIIIPEVIIELKYAGVNTHGLITYSNYASDIKGIFPDCKYYLVLLYRKDTSDNKFLRHGKVFDKILCLMDGSPQKKYSKGEMSRLLKNCSVCKSRFDELVSSLESDLSVNKTPFIK